MGIEITVRRMLRAALLVLVATWMGYAAGEEGLREVFRRTLRRLRRIPAMAEAGVVLDGLGSTQSLAESGKRLIARLKGVEPDPLPITDAVDDRSVIPRRERRSRRLATLSAIQSSDVRTAIVAPLLRAEGVRGGVGEDLHPLTRQHPVVRLDRIAFRSQ